MPAMTSLLLGGAALGGIAGALGGKKEATYDQSGPKQSMQRLQDFRPGTAGVGTQNQALQQIMGLSGGQEAQSVFGAQTDLASLLGQYSQSGGLPGQQDIAASQAFAAQQFAPQQLAMQQAFTDQIRQANQQAALSGRAQNDPILRAKLAQEQTRQQNMLSAQQAALAGQTAFGLSDRRLQYAEGRANVLQGALQNRLGLAQNIFSLGQQQSAQDLQRGQQQLSAMQASGQLAANAAQLQLGKSQANQDLGGGIGGALKGALGGIGAGASAGGFLGAGSQSPIGNFFGGLFGPSQSPTADALNYNNFGQASIPKSQGPGFGFKF